MHEDNGSRIPGAVRERFGNTVWERVTEGESGASVWQSDEFVLKLQARGRGTVATLAHERDRLRWLASLRVEVPDVVEYAVTVDAEYLVTSRLRGIPMSHGAMRSDPERVVRLLGTTLRTLHELPTRGCPFDMRLDRTLEQVGDRVARGEIDEEDFDDTRRGWTARAVYDEVLRTRPADEDVVVTHGDACFPNFIVDGQRVAMVDVGRCGLADRHMDLALAHRSARFNIDARAAGMLLDAYGRDRIDRERIEYYALLDELL